MEPIEFKVYSITAREAGVDVELHGKLHPVFTSTIFLHLDQHAISKFSIGQIYKLSKLEPVEVIETVPLGAGVMDERPTDDDTWGSV